MTARRHHSPAIEIATASGSAPEWVQLTPAGPALPSADGRRHRLSDPAAVVARFRARALPVPIDVEHATHIRGTQGLDAPAYGWIRDMEVREGALWGRVEWTEQGAAWVASRAYKFLSIGYTLDKPTGEITEILSAGLVNRPGFVMPELARETEETDQMDKAVLDALGLASDASAADVVAKIKDLQTEVHTAKAAPPDPQVYVAKSQLDAANARIGELEAAETARAEEALVALVDDGIEKLGKITPPARDSFIAVARAQGVEAFKATLAAMPRILPGKSELDDKSTTRTAKGLTPEDQEVARAMGISDEDFATAKAQE